MKHVVVYTRNNCAACFGVKAKLKSENVPFKEINIEHEGNEHHAQSLVDDGYRAMPVVSLFDGKRIISEFSGSNHQKLREIMDIMLG